MGGLMDYKARFYSPYLNHFIQPDSIVPDWYSPKDLNRYSYVYNSPINNNDPTGHFANILVGAAIGAIVGGALYAANAYVHGNEINGTDLAIAVGVGAVAGGLIGSGAGAVSGFALIAHSAGIGMATSAVGYTIAAGKNYKSSEMLVSASVGLVAGAVSGGVSNAFAKPLPINYGGCLNQTSRWAAQMLTESGVNALAGAAQQIGTNIVNGKAPLSGAGPAFVLGGSAPAAIDVLVGPGWGGVARNIMVESFNNEMLERLPQNEKVNRQKAVIRRNSSSIVMQ